MKAYHRPVMAAESLEGLALRADGTYVDATFGGGGHSALILERLGDNGRLIGFDQDEDAARNVPSDPRLRFVPHNFRYLRRFLRLYGLERVDGILADLGVSSHQLDAAQRGFSYRYDARLDMRMNQQQEITAADIVQRYSAAELQRLFSEFGEVRNARSLAECLVTERQLRPLDTIANFLSAIEPLIRGKRERYLAQVFQALRMEVNDEMGALADFLQQSVEALNPGGRLVVIAYHSVEDRLVKNIMRSGNPGGELKQDFFGHISRPFRLITKKAMEPSEAEIQENPRARSARLRIAERIEKTTEREE